MTREAGKRPPGRVRDLILITYVQETCDVDEKDKVPPSLHHAVAIVFGRNAHSRLFIQLAFSTLDGEFVTMTVSLGKRPFM